MFYRKLHTFIFKLFSRCYFLINLVRFRLYGIKHGVHLRVVGIPYLQLHATSRVEIGDYFTFTNGRGSNPLARNIRGCIKADSNATIIIGDNVGISSGVIRAKSSIKIGNNVKIGAGTTLIDTDSHSLDWRIRSCNEFLMESKDSSEAKTSPIEIGDDVLIGFGCIILKGVKVGNRSIIGAGSVVTKDIPSDVIAAGNPCKVIRRI